MDINNTNIQEIIQLNQELDSIVKDFDKYVIASRTDLKGNITYASNAYQKISGYSQDELLGKPHNIVRHPDMPKEAFEDMWNTIKNERIWKGEVKNLRSDGTFYWVLTNVSPHYDKNGKHIGYSAIRHDITDQKRAEELSKQLEELNNSLEEQVLTRIAEVHALNEEIKETQKEVVFTMGAIGEARSKETGDHVKRVAQYSEILALAYGLSCEDAALLKEASPMHDIGKVAIPDSILNKNGRLTPEEKKIMNTHATLGFDMLKNSQRELLKVASSVAHDHHERWDGTGYPRGIKEEQISIYGRITAVADVFDALGSSRVYKKAWKDKDIFTMFEEEKGKHFEPKLVDLFFENLEDILAVRKKFNN
ncbi:MAG: PAS domain S-box protein [Campylobacterota bacterium]|nr:PAS domain S-box protein [Campylobacterota bacterium]